MAVRVHFFHWLAVIKTHRRPELGYTVGKESPHMSRPWRAHEAIQLAVLDVILAGISYLLSVYSPPH